MQKVTVHHLQKLHQYFRQNDNVLLAYLFGSQVSGRIGPLSDIDIGIFVSEEISFDEKYYLEVDLRKILAVRALDLIIMNRAPLPLQYQIICGKCIYRINERTRVEYEASTLIRYFDYLPVLNQQRQETLNTVKHEQQIQRNRIALGKTEKLLAEIRALSAKNAG